MTSDFYSIDDGVVSYSRDQSSRFAKSVAGDFNPIHDPDSRRFCVPGDLLFATMLDLIGLHSRMEFEFLSMVDDTHRVSILHQDSKRVMRDRSGKDLLSVSLTGMNSNDSGAVESLTDAYVKFSGQTFPFLLVDLMQQKQMMINPARPLVIYKSMTIDLQQLNFQHVELSFREAQFTVNGKKGQVSLEFDLSDKGKQIGSGTKQMLLGGLQVYDDLKMKDLVSQYNAIKDNFEQVQH